MCRCVSRTFRRWAFGRDRQAEVADSRAGVEDEHGAVGEGDLHARGVAAVAGGFRPGRRGRIRALPRPLPASALWSRCVVQVSRRLELLDGLALVTHELATSAFEFVLQSRAVSLDPPYRHHLPHKNVAADRLVGWGGCRRHSGSIVPTNLDGHRQPVRMPPQARPHAVIRRREVRGEVAAGDVSGRPPEAVSYRFPVVEPRRAPSAQESAAAGSAGHGALKTTRSVRRLPRPPPRSPRPRRSPGPPRGRCA